jgi:regulatory protein
MRPRKSGGEPTFLTCEIFEYSAAGQFERLSIFCATNEQRSLKGWEGGFTPALGERQPCDQILPMRRQRSRSNPDNANQPRLTPEELRARTFQRAAKLLAAKPRSIAELRERLAERCSSKAIVETVIARLREYGYLDDERYALTYASSKVRQQPVGRRRLEHSLVMKRVDRKVAEGALDQVFAETPEEELIDRAIEKRVRLRGRPKTRAEAKSLFDHLLRQGFPFELVGDKVRAASKTDLEEIE